MRDNTPNSNSTAGNGTASSSESATIGNEDSSSGNGGSPSNSSNTGQNPPSNNSNNSGNSNNNGNSGQVAPTSSGIENSWLISGELDDADEDKQTGTIDTSGQLNLGANVVGLRFLVNNIPTGANIERAYIQFTAAGNTSEAGWKLISGQKSSSTASFATELNNITSRPQTATTAKVSWNPGAWTMGEQLEQQKTPNIAGVIQEIIDDSEWDGTYIALFVEGEGARLAHSYNTDPNNAPKLHITWNTSKTSDVLVIGAGLAGITTAKKLKEKGFVVKIIEARNRAGGRMNTDYTTNIPLELRAQWVNSTEKIAKESESLWGVNDDNPPWEYYNNNPIYQDALDCGLTLTQVDEYGLSHVFNADGSLNNDLTDISNDGSWYQEGTNGEDNVEDVAWEKYWDSLTGFSVDDLLNNNMGNSWNNLTSSNAEKNMFKHLFSRCSEI
ncbi:MAG: NAD(P)-binding protein [Oligoflexales bacterium]|nr:NAD(P)-binding protein [Oligoflexales bacterium]